MPVNLDTDTTPRAWIGCLACYNAGRLVGEWFDAEDADDVTLADVHGGTDRVRTGCEELWVMDHENMPRRGEMSPHEASEWARVALSVPEHERPALCAWVASGDYTAEGDGDLPSVSDFEDRYVGRWPSFREYAENLADDIGLLAGAPEALVSYFNWEAWSRDLAFDYTTEPAPGGDVYVFRVL
ncbi:antirestriction protein ArdA [Brevibacterium aurantiacum]|uniref:Antirestriction protein n=1 Tax=Brevibacterium aurantiacum TaxID=273384 RepID=A0A2A3Z2X9_BREAU|nr:antirestriction protein ArdA [Brevibacterium aurantiacum]PCC45843.1 antirestriction protein [Brevibacterium aurantiacum]